MTRKLKKISKEEHLKCAKDLRKAQEILEPWMHRFWEAYPRNDARSIAMRKVLNILSSKLCCLLDDDWYEDEDDKTPYYGSGKIAW